MFNILVAEDDKDLRELFCSVLNDSGYHAVLAENGEEALRLRDSVQIDLIITDIMMPRMDGLELIRALRETGDTTPVLIITARSAASDMREGFRIGTDDYMVKPINVNEMVWRVEALLRRSQLVSQRKTVIGSTELDCDSLSVRSGDQTWILPQKEFFLLYKLLTSPGRIFTRHQIMDDIWGPDSDADTHTLEVHISRLRERFRDVSDFEIVTVRGLGYKGVLR